MEFHDGNTLNKALQVIEETETVSGMAAQDIIRRLSNAGFLIREFKEDEPSEPVEIQPEHGTLESLQRKFYDFRNDYDDLHDRARKLMAEFQDAVYSFSPVFKAIQMAMEAKDDTSAPGGLRLD